MTTPTDVLNALQLKFDKRNRDIYFNISVIKYTERIQLKEGSK
jgi:hypothetical protein